MGMTDAVHEVLKSSVAAKSPRKGIGDEEY